MTLSLREQIDELRRRGYGADTAQAKVVHDVVLLAMHRSGFKSNSTIKGGVVMSSLTGDVHRATMDMDIDFIRYSLGKPAVVRFVRRLVRALPEVELKMVGEPVELKHEDYRGKRIYLAVKDASVSRWIRTKVDKGHLRHVLSAGAGWCTEVEEICCGTCLCEFTLPREGPCSADEVCSIDFRHEDLQVEVAEDASQLAGCLADGGSGRIGCVLGEACMTSCESFFLRANMVAMRLLEECRQSRTFGRWAGAELFRYIPHR